MQSNKRRELERLSDTYKSNLEKAEVAFLEGRGKLLDKNTVEVNGKQYMVSHLFVLQQSLIVFPCTVSLACLLPYHIGHRCKPEQQPQALTDINV